MFRILGLRVLVWGLGFRGFGISGFEVFGFRALGVEGLGSGVEGFGGFRV